MDRYKWVFKQNGGTATADNIAGKLFLNDYAPLVRESIQNSLDAAIDKDKPVKVVYKFGQITIPEDSPFLELEKWVDGGMEKFPDNTKRAYKNLKNIKTTLAEIKQKGNLCYLEVSDENTTGMDYTQDKRLQSGTRFYSFTKSLGNSSKASKTSAGSHGVGKVVFQKMSKLNTIFVSSKSSEDGSELFEGVSELCTSLIGDNEYEYRGYYCLDETQEPTTEHDKIPEQFRRPAFGTSVYVMGVSDKEEDQNSCLRDIEKAVVENFWLSILQGKLVVQIDNNVVEKDSIINLAEKVFNNPELYNTFNSFDTRKYIEAVWLAGVDGKHIHKIDNSIPELGEIHLYVLKDKKGDNCIQYMRETRMRIKTERLPNYGFYGVFICDGAEGNKNLRNSENAEHNQWNSNECEDKTDKQNALRAIKGINKFINTNLLEIFGGNSTGKSDISGAEEFLFMNVASDELEDPEMEVLFGKPKDFQEKESPKQTTLFEDFQISPKKQERHGHVVIEESETASIDEEGDLHGGKTDKPHNPQPGPLPPLAPTENHNYKQDEEGAPGLFIRSIKVKYRPFFQKENGTIYHYLSITPSESCLNATIELTVKGDEDNDNIFVVQSSHGTPEENKISGLSFTQNCRLLLRLKFEDNLPHPITLKAYEYKK